MKRMACLVILPLLLAACALEDPLARVVRVIDGDSLIVVTGGREEEIRLAGINAPEFAAPCEAERRLARAARAHLDALVGASPVVALRSPTIWWWRRDRYGRLVAHVRATSPHHQGLSGPDFGAVMVKAGHARYWWSFMPKPSWCGDGP